MNTSWSRKKIHDKFTNLRKADGTPMSRQQLHMLRKKARGDLFDVRRTGHRRILPQAYHRRSRANAT